MLGSKRPSMSSPVSRDIYASGDLIRAMPETSHDCIKVVATDGRLMQMNPAGLAMVNADSWEQVENADTCDLIAPEHRNHWLANHERGCNGATLVWGFGIV